MPTIRFTLNGTATATDTWTPITAAEYRVGAGPWLDMTPTAPPFNALSEGLTVAFLAPSAGTYNVCARARDVGRRLAWVDAYAALSAGAAAPCGRWLRPVTLVWAAGRIGGTPAGTRSRRSPAT